jgi:hypothetical protein
MPIHNGNFTMTNKCFLFFNSLTSKEEKNAISYIQVALKKNSSYLFGYKLWNDKWFYILSNEIVLRKSTMNMKIFY